MHIPTAHMCYKPSYNKKRRSPGCKRQEYQIGEATQRKGKYLITLLSYDVTLNGPS